MKVIVIGGTGHVGGFMVPMLVDAGCEVIVIGSGKTPAPTTGKWEIPVKTTCTAGRQRTNEVQRDKALWGLRRFA